MVKKIQGLPTVTVSFDTNTTEKLIMHNNTNKICVPK